MNEAEMQKFLDDFLEEIEEKSWDELLSKTGKHIEDIGRMIRGKGRKKPRVWTVEELEDLRTALKDTRSMIKYYIEHLKAENADS